MDRKINYSIIIPHKNIPKLLQRCLDSIPRRDDVQIIVVDDNSDPDKVDFEHFPGLGDPFVEVVFTKEGKGAGYARNVGLTKAVGKWLLFADADDFYNYCISEVLDEYVNSDADIIYFKHNSVDSDEYITTSRCTSYNNYLDNWSRSNKKVDYILRYKHPFVWAKLFKKNLINNNIFFDEVSMSNDVAFAYLMGFYANSICVDLGGRRIIKKKKGSIGHSERTIENKLDILFVCGKNYLFYLEHDIPLFNKIFFINMLTKIYFLNKTHFYKAREILFNLGFTSYEIIGLCIYNVLIYLPHKMVRKLFHDNMGISIFHLKLGKFLHNR
jgi:glycosyltransferase involved in cell wall biosynthesis